MSKAIDALGFRKCACGVAHCPNQGFDESIACPLVACHCVECVGVELWATLGTTREVWFEVTGATTPPTWVYVEPAVS